MRGRPLFLLFFLLVPVFTVAENSSSLYRKGARYALQGDFENAETAFKESIRLSRWSCLPHYGLGKLYLTRKETVKKALPLLRRAVTLDRNHAPSHFYLGMALMFNDKPAEAVKSFKRAYEIDPSMVAALYNMAVLFEKMGRDHQALVHYREYYRRKDDSGDNFPF